MFKELQSNVIILVNKDDSEEFSDHKKLFKNINLKLK